MKTIPWKEMSDYRVRAPRSSRWRHLKSGGTYQVVDTVLIEATVEPAIVYHSLNDGPKILWVRPAAEFFERFEPIDMEPMP